MPEDEQDNRLSLFTSEPVRPGADIPVFYQSQESKPHNWIGLHREGEEEFCAFAYAPGSAGVAMFSGSSFDRRGGVGPGNYRLYLYEGAGRTVLAGPVALRLTSAPYFLVDSLSAANVLAGRECRVALRGLLEACGREVTFAKVRGDFWLEVTGDGTVVGVAPESAAGRYGLITVAARARTSGERTTVTVRVPVRPEQGPLVDELRVATWNLWYDATQVWAAKAKVLRMVAEQNLDIVAMQEVRQKAGTVKELAERLGWYFQEHPGTKDVGVMSRYPIDVSRSGHGAEFLRSTVSLNDLLVHVCCVHLDYHAYGPFKAPEGTRRFTAAVQQEEMRSQRAAEMRDKILAEIAPQLDAAHRSPVIVLGDFNCPSHLDWASEVTSDPANWPATLLLEEAGLQDSYRVAHPDPGAHPGLTWSPAQPWDETYLDPARVEPQDRVDFIFHKGDRLRVADSMAYVAGQPAPAEDHPQWKKSASCPAPLWWYNAWPSDHASVITTYRIER
ncbi:MULTISPECIES: endonuclease/exonuclease/phosphatase family protein [Streptomyces]|uniref:endonuclease/exonuclease/phosphatase family protein n=1 Tax=Streptomyces TaxID=1883 RepID=UPI00067C8ECC|nr:MULTISPECIES: endonuclease/exonuclease/phosphatase family protein [Streptomyces]